MRRGCTDTTPPFSVVALAISAIEESSSVSNLAEREAKFVLILELACWQNVVASNSS